MKKNISIDVIIPTYNGLPWLKATIDSVLAQTHKDLTLYIVDDGSADKTKEYVNSLKDKRVVNIYQKNNGQSSARNLGVSKSSSPFIAFLDSDDIWYPTKLEKQLAIMMAKADVGLVYGHHYLIDEEDVIQGNLRLWKRGNILDDLCGGNIIAGSASMVLVRREILEKAGPFREDFVNGEDWELWIRIAMLCEIDFVPEIMAAIRQRKNSEQVNTKKMADGLVYAHGVMTNTLTLTKTQRISISTYCLFNASASYLSIGLRPQARRTMIKLFKENPRLILHWDDWKIHYAVGLFSRVVIGNSLFDIMMRVFRKAKRGARKVINLIYRIVRRCLKFLKHRK